jgi:AraC-like DNA-binding protein
MTQKGEVITVKGESNDHTFSLERHTSIHYSACATSFKYITEVFKAPSKATQFQMVFILKGTISGYVTGDRKPTLTLSEQQHNIILLHENFRLQVKTQTHEIVFIAIDHSFFTRYIPVDHSGYLNLRNGIEEDKHALFSTYNLHITPEISGILNAVRTSTHSGFCENLFRDSKILELLALQLLQFEQLKDYAPARALKKDELDKMYQVKEILTGNMSLQFSLRSLAHMVGTNEFNLKRNFKLAFGTTVFGYLNQHKMLWAKQMLIDKDITVAEVSEKMGYKYATHFSSAFKKYFGYLPNKIKSGKLSIFIFVEDFSVILENLEMLLGL